MTALPRVFDSDAAPSMSSTTNETTALASVPAGQPRRGGVGPRRVRVGFFPRPVGLAPVVGEVFAASAVRRAWLSFRQPHTGIARRRLVAPAAKVTSSVATAEQARHHPVPSGPPPGRRGLSRRAGSADLPGIASGRLPGRRPSGSDRTGRDDRLVRSWPDRRMAGSSSSSGAGRPASRRSIKRDWSTVSSSAGRRAEGS